MNEGNTGKQERNIMILFLSDFRLQDTEGVKTLNRNFEASYKFHDGTEDDIKCTLTNEAPIRDVVKTLQCQNQTLDKIVYFVTSALRDGPFALLDAGTVQNYASKEALFQKRIRAMCAPYLDDTKFVDIPFNDKSDSPMQECIQAVVNMANEIKGQMSSDDKKKCRLFADITGGLRTANMAMTAVMQLLQYEKVNVELVLYSDGNLHSISNVQPINDMYLLVAGVDAFYKYGSSAAIGEYFEGVEYAELQNLLVAMDHFSESVLLCQPNDIEKNLEALMTALENFPKEPEAGEVRPPKVELFARMVDDLIKKYTPMYPKTEDGERKTDRLEIIRWCVDNTLFQQAATFCTEWLPEYFVDWGVLYTEDLAVQRYCGGTAFPKYRTWKKNLIMQFCTKDVYKEDKETNKTCLDIITDIAAGLEIPSQIRERIKHEAARQELSPNFENGEIMTSNRWNWLPRNILSGTEIIFGTIKEDLRNLKQHQPFSPSMKKVSRLLKQSFGKPWLEVVAEHSIDDMAAAVFRHVYRFSLNRYEAMLNIGKGRYRYQGNYHYEKLTEERYREEEQRLYESMRKEAINAAAVTRTMFDCGLLKTDLEEDEAVHHIREYTYIRARLRNKMNHGSEEESQDDIKDYVQMTIPEIGDYLERYLGEIFTLRKRLASMKNASEEATP